MKVLYFHQHFSTPEGATGTRSFQMAKRLVKEGHTVVVVCGSYEMSETGLKGGFVKGMRRGTVEGFEVIEFDLTYSNSDSFIQRTKKFIRYAAKSSRVALFEPCDLVVSTSTPLTVALPGILARLFRRKPFVFEVRDLWPELPKAMGVITNPVVLALMSTLESMAYYFSCRQIALSPGILDGIAKKTGKPQDICLVPNGSDVQLFSPGITPWRPQGVSPGEFVAVFAGTHGIANGLDALLDVAAELKNREKADIKRERTDIKIVLTGAGKLKSQLASRAKAEQLDNVVFVDPLRKEKLAQLLAGADLGLQVLANIPAFYYGTSPNKFFDYIAAGLPVLNNYRGWLKDMIDEYDCGYTVEPDNPKQFADLLEQAADNRLALSQKGINARQLAENQFDWQVLSTSWVKWLIGAVDKQQAETPHSG